MAGAKAANVAVADPCDTVKLREVGAGAGFHHGIGMMTAALSIVIVMGGVLAVPLRRHSAAFLPPDSMSAAVV